MSYLLRWLVVIFLIWIALRIWKRRRTRPMPDRSVTVPLVKCAHCGVHLPRTEALVDDTRYYCSAAHRDLGSTSA